MSHEFNVNLGKKIGERMAAAAVRTAAYHIQTAAKKLLNRGGPGPPSQAPKPPHKQTGALGRSIQVDERQVKGSKPFARVGPDGKVIPYAARLEFGFYGTDKNGVRILQTARPYMRRALTENSNEAMLRAKKAAQKAFAKIAARGGQA